MLFVAHGACSVIGYVMKVSADASYQLLAARYVRRQLKQLTGQLDGIRRAEDVESVHRARVASRRLRAGLRMFDDCFGRKKVKRWRKQIRRLGESLGEARDKDVQIQFVCGVLSRLQETALCPGIARLLVKLEHQREEIQPKVLKAVDRLVASPVPAEMLQTTRSLVTKLGKRGVRLDSEFVFRQAEKHITGRVGDLLGYQGCLGDAEDQDGHHALRIAAKRLRYTMEICKPVYRNRLDEFIGTVKEVQQLLGEIHDCDVWVETLGQLLEEERQRLVKFYHHSGPLARLQTGIDYLRTERQEQRGQLFEKLVQYWQEVGRMRLWDELTETVHARSTAVSERPAQDGVAAARGGERRPAAGWQKPILDGGRDQASIGIQPRPAAPRPKPSLVPEGSLEESN